MRNIFEKTKVLINATFTYTVLIFGLFLFIFGYESIVVQLIGYLLIILHFYRRSESFNFLNFNFFVRKSNLQKVAIILGLFFIITFVRNGFSFNRSYKVLRVIDGDTFVVSKNGTSRNVRLSGIDTPETKHPSKPIECYGAEAAIELKRLIGNKYVKLSFQGKGKYGRDLAYVYVDGMCVNEWMITEGYAYHLSKYKHKYLDKYNKLQKQAERYKKGLWRYCY